jgi:hypothetical protein
MKRLLIAAVAALFVASLAPVPAYAGAQQDKMKACNKEAGEKKLKGDERKAFMKECLSADAPAKPTQQEKMKSCNKEASEKKLKGDERKAFMSTCLKG